MRTPATCIPVDFVTNSSLPASSVALPQDRLPTTLKRSLYLNLGEQPSCLPWYPYTPEEQTSPSQPGPGGLQEPQEAGKPVRAAPVSRGS